MSKTISVCALMSPVALILGACDANTSGESTSSGEPVNASELQKTAAADPCSFLSKEEAAAITGEAVVQTEADDRTCRYETEDSASSLQIEVHPTGGTEEMQIARSVAGALGDIGADMKGSPGAESDTGNLLTEKGAAPAIGDQAFFGPNQQLHVLKGDSYFAVLPPIMRSRMGEGSPMLPVEKKREIAAAIALKIDSKL